MKTTYSALVGLTAAAMLSLGATGTASAEVTLKGASCFPIGSPPSRPYEAVVKTINERGKGLVKIDMVGGAPAIGGIFDITRRAARGTYDIIGCTEASKIILICFLIFWVAKCFMVCIYNFKNMTI